MKGFQTYVVGAGQKNILATVRWTDPSPYTPAGTYYIGAHYQTLAQNFGGAATTITDYYYSPHYIDTLALQICHPVNINTACPG